MSSLKTGPLTTNDPPNNAIQYHASASKTVTTDSSGCKKDETNTDTAATVVDKDKAESTAKSRLIVSVCVDEKTKTSSSSIETPPPGNNGDDFATKFAMYNVNEELLGSVTTLSSPAVRTSARVIQKMKMDSIRPASPPPSVEKEATKEMRPQQKTPNQPKANKVIWTNIERNLFFEAINEYGKDFEAIGLYINNKQKRKNVTDPTYKTKENVRQLYHQTFHKVSKYLRFSDGKSFDGDFKISFFLQMLPRPICPLRIPSV